MLEADIAASIDGHPELSASERLYVIAHGSSLPRTSMLQEEDQPVSAEEAVSTEVQATAPQGTAQDLLGSAAFTAPQWQPLHAIMPSFSQLASAQSAADWLQPAAVPDAALSLNEFEGLAQLSAPQLDYSLASRLGPSSAMRSSASRFNLRRGADLGWLQGMSTATATTCPAVLCALLLMHCLS